jgi:hypothetical protein
VHLPGRERVLDSLVGSLRPGGWIVIEDFDNMFLDVGSAATPEQAAGRKVALAFKRLLQDRGADVASARRLRALLSAPLTPSSLAPGDTLGFRRIARPPISFSGCARSSTFT